MTERFDIEATHWKWIDQVWRSMDPVQVAFISGSYEGSLGLALSTLTDNRFFNSKDHHISLKVESPQSICVRCPDLELRPIWVNLVDGWSSKPMITSILTATGQLNVDERMLSLDSRDPFKRCHELIYSLQWLFNLSSYSRHFSFAVKSGDRFIRDEFKEGRPLRLERLSIDEVADTGFELKVEMEPAFFPDHGFELDKIRARFADFHWGEMEHIGDLSLVTIEGVI